jgi:hypothetical protein
MKKILQWISCHIMNDHDWTCNADRGIKPTEKQMKNWSGLKEYSKMYCKYCGKMSKLNDLL